MSGTVSTVPTPNPDALMFRVNEVLVPMGTHEFKPGDDTADAPLARALLAHDGIELILVAPRFVTVRKQADTPWPDLEGVIRDTIAEFLESGEMAVIEPASATEAEREYTDVEKRILELLDEEIRPAIAQDGGDVSFESFEDGVVYLRLTGACGTCPSSVTTLKMGIERLLIEEIPEVTAVENTDPLPGGQPSPYERYLS
jgi:Fe-S cluster biogenesis protein NfuA